MAIMLLVPITAGAGAHGLSTIPIKSFGISTSYSVSNAGCAKAKQLVSPHWTGTAYLAAGKANAPKCKPSPSGNYASWDAYINLQASVHFKTSGTHSINAAWAVTESSTWTVSPYSSCVLNYTVSYSTCTVTAGAEVYGYAYLYDQTNGSFVTYPSGSGGQSNFTTVENYSQNYCYSGTCYHYGGNVTFGGGSGSFTGSFYQNDSMASITVNKTHSYTLYVTVLVFADAEAEVIAAHSTGVGTASALVNMGTPGNGARLVGVTVT
jgi:hypothetical protein